MLPADRHRLALRDNAPSHALIENEFQQLGSLHQGTHVRIPAEQHWNFPVADRLHAHALRDNAPSHQLIDNELEHLLGVRGGAASLPLRVAAEVHPSVAVERQVVSQIVRRQTVNALHQNLESKTGQFLKRLFQLPFKRHSETDAPAAASFRPSGLEAVTTNMGIALGGLFPQGEAPAAAATARPAGPAAPGLLDRRGSERQEETVHQGAPTPGAVAGKTRVIHRDAALDMGAVDAAFAHHFRQGYAY